MKNWFSLVLKDLLVLEFLITGGRLFQTFGPINESDCWTTVDLQDFGIIWLLLLVFIVEVFSLKILSNALGNDFLWNLNISEPISDVYNSFIVTKLFFFMMLVMSSLFELKIILRNLFDRCCILAINVSLPKHQLVMQ